MLNNGKSDKDMRIKKAVTCSQNLWKHVPSVFNGQVQKDVTSKINTITPAEVKKKAESLTRSKMLDPSNPAYVKTDYGADPMTEEVQYLLHSIDPAKLGLYTQETH
jgi:hypothetical protein